jgi:hypothetical protein
MWLLALIAPLGCASPALQSRSQLGFWWEPVSYTSTLIGGALTEADLATIDGVARAEIAQAFADLPIALTDSREARYRIRVVQDVRDERNRWLRMSVAGESRGSRHFGGAGSVNFSYFAAGATVFAPAGATRDEMIRAIGRGVGRGAVHEFAHVLLPDVQIHTRDRDAYEYYAASRQEQYYGALRWAGAWPRLVERFGRERRLARR